jgi:Zn-dependent M16 (insulinase) family peptidase
MNKLNPEKENRHEYEQPGCLHTNMDLYKWCYTAMPGSSSDLLWRCFILAKDIRELDMRASPYDLTEYKLSPVKIETKAGREEYEKIQREFSERAAPIRKDLIEKLNEVTVEDIQRVAETYIKKSNRTVGMIKNVEEDSSDDEMVNNENEEEE